MPEPAKRKPDCSELSLALARLAFLHAGDPNVKNLDDVVARIQKDHPGLTRQDVAKAIEEATTGHVQALTDAERQLNAIKREARRDAELRRQIAEAERLIKEGLLPTSESRPETATDAIKALEAVRDTLNKRLADSPPAKAAKMVHEAVRDAKADAKEAQRLREQIADMRQSLASGTVPPKPVRAESDASVAVKVLRAERDALAKEIDRLPAAAKARAEKAAPKQLAALDAQIAALEQNLAAGTLPPQTPAKPSPATEAVQAKRAERDAKRKALSQSEAAQIKRMAESLDRAKEKLAKTYIPIKADPPSNTPASKQLQRMAYERDRIKAQIRENIRNMAPKSTWAKATGLAGEVLNAPRTLITSLDASAPGRQGLILSVANPRRALGAGKAMFEALASPTKAHAINEEILNRPNAPQYARAKLYLAPLEGAPALNQREEAFMSKLAERIPVLGKAVSASQQAYVTYLNKMRADTFDAMVDTMTRGGEATDQEAKALASFINVATGRGDLGKLEQAATSLNTIFFSPRYLASRVQFLAGTPLYKGNAATRKAIAKEYGKFMLGSGLILLLANLAGGELEADPRSSDFGKVKIGNTRLDPFAGMSQIVTLGSRLATGETKTAKGEIVPIRHADTVNKKGKTVDAVGYGARDAGEILGTFMRSKFAPIPGAAVNLIEGENVVGERVTAASTAKDLLVPLSFRDIYATMQEQGVPRGTAISILNLFGVGVQNHEQRASKSPPPKKRPSFSDR